MKNDDDRCFVYAVLAALHSNEIPVYMRNIASSYEPYIHTLNLNGIGFPLMDREIPIFEKNNPEMLGLPLRHAIKTSVRSHLEHSLHKIDGLGMDE